MNQEIKIHQIFSEMKVQVLNMKPIDHIIKFIVDNKFIFVIDGTGNKNVIIQDQDIYGAKSTVKTDSQTFLKMKRGELTPIMGLMSGKVDIEGSIGFAFKMKFLLSK